MAMENQLSLEIVPPLYAFREHYLPRRPLCAHTKAGTYKRRAKDDALDAFEFIETTPKVLKNFLVFDVDHTDLHIPRDLPSPSWVSQSPTTGHYHVAWGLRSPIGMTDFSRLKPQRLGACVEAGLADLLDADHSYGGRIMKNPLSPAHLTVWGENESVGVMPLYDLKDLATALKEKSILPAYKPKNLLYAELGRNCALFESVRTKAYRSRGDFTDYNAWSRWVSARAYEINENFISDPLAAAEIATIARSVTTWTWKNIHESFTDWCTRRGRYGAPLGGQRTLEIHGVDHFSSIGTKGGKKSKRPKIALNMLKKELHTYGR